MKCGVSCRVVLGSLVDLNVVLCCVVQYSEEEMSEVEFYNAMLCRDVTYNTVLLCCAAQCSNISCCRALLLRDNYRFCTVHLMTSSFT